MKSRYFVTTIRLYYDKQYNETCHDCRCIGFYERIVNARGILGKDLDEAGYYKYAVIEKFSPGWYPYSRSEEWYQFTRKGVKRINKPKRFARVKSFGIG